MQIDRYEKFSVLWSNLRAKTDIIVQDICDGDHISQLLFYLKEVVQIGLSPQGWRRETLTLLSSYLAELNNTSATIKATERKR